MHWCCVGRVVEIGDAHLPLTGWRGYYYIAGRCRSSLRIDGSFIIFPVINDVRATCQELLGLTPDEGALTGKVLRLKWLHDNFGAGSTEDVSKDIVRQLVRAYILALLSDVLFCR